MADLKTVAAAVEAEKRGLLPADRRAALNELRRRASAKNQNLAGYLEPILTVGTAAVAEPISGLVGLAGLPFGVDASANAIRRTQDALTYKPRTQEGQQGLETVGRVMQPVANAMESASEFAGDTTLNLTGSEEAAALAYALPSVAPDLLGLKAANVAGKAGKLGRQFELGDVGGQAFGQRGAVSGAGGNAQRLFHASDVDFDEFDPTRVGDRLTALGLGHYLTPNKSKAQQYGSNVMEFDVDMSNVLDLDNMTPNQRKSLESEIINFVPDDRLAGFGERKFKVLPRGKQGADEFKLLKEQTKDNYHEYSRAQVADDDDLPDSILDGLGPDDVVVTWMEFDGSLDSATPHQLVAMMQEYDQTIPQRLGYSGAKFGDEVAIYDPKLAKRVRGQ